MADTWRMLPGMLCCCAGHWKNKQARRVVPARFSFSVPLRVFISAVYMNMYCKFRAFFLRSLVMC